MIDQFLNKLGSLSYLSHSTRDMLKPFITVNFFEKGDFILKQEEICRDLFYIQSGFAREYYFKKGKDVTEWFAGTESFCFSIESYFNNTPSNLIIEALEPSKVIFLSKEGLMGLSKNNIEISRLATTFFSYSLIASQRRMESIHFQSAKERYLYLIEQQPKILQKVPLSHIASFLGITQETLSRIRSKI
ncbi:Crp/Fnr family transcriptional regulator [Leeuwenhoekiella sp. W20_SRS_FM14]|uniref:Crp/Fnr family transcriptional regulator n=1 Tax=Leeuwenhoekiella sp. W20_SRS_FM14 TaxID=3240270 RepID=UPI003F9E90F6